MQNVIMNPHRQPRANELDAAGRPRVSTIIIAITAIWLAALVVAAIGYRVGSGDWPGFVDGVLLPLTYGVVALPGGLANTLGRAGLGLIAWPLGLLFWPLVLGLQVAACYRRRWRFLAPVGVLVALAAWNWVAMAYAMMSV
jgi:hypothetical protein